MTDSKPDSLLSGVRKLAEFADLPWPQVQRHYRLLQEEPADGAWLPKSVGRQIWYASPPLIARVLIALADPDPERAPDTVAWARALSRVGQGAAAGPFDFELRLADLLSQPSAAERIRAVEIYLFARQARISFTDGSDDEIWCSQGDAGEQPLIGPMGGAISGELLRRVRDGVSWRLDAPYATDNSAAIPCEAWDSSRGRLELVDA